MNIKQNISLTYSESTAWIITLLGSVVFASISFYFTDFALVAGNMGKTHAIAELISQITLSILFGVNLALLWFQLKSSAKLNVDEAGSLTLGSVAGLIVSGCPSCGITLASYVGLASLFSSLPFYGLELKVAGILLLIYSIRSIAKNIGKCEVTLAVDAPVSPK